MSETVPQKPGRATDAEIDAVEEYLRNHAVEDTVTTSEIETEVPGLGSDHDTSPPVREVVQFLVLSGRLCIDGSGNGYQVAATEADRDDALQSLRDHVGTLNRRIQALKDADLAHEDSGGDGRNEESTTTKEQSDESQWTSSVGGDCDECNGNIMGDPWLEDSRELCRECYQGGLR